MEESSGDEGATAYLKLRCDPYMRLPQAVPTPHPVLVPWQILGGTITGRGCVVEGCDWPFLHYVSWGGESWSSSCLHLL